jgi:hypothetical protein
VAGQIAGDAIRSSDLVCWTRDGVDRREKCTGVMAMLVGAPSNPPMLGLVVSNAEPDDFTQGVVVEVYRSRSDRSVLS